MILFHVGALLCTVLCVLYADEQGLMWLLGKKDTLSLRRMHRLHILVSSGLVIIITTGAYMVSSSLDYYLTSTVFLLKMSFVGILVINAFWIGSLLPIATYRSFKSLSAKERMPLLLSAGLSALCWVGAIVCGLLLSGWW